MSVRHTVPVESDLQVKMDKIPNIVKLFLFCGLIQVISASDMDCGVRNLAPNSGQFAISGDNTDNPSECPSNLTCINQKCRDSCPGVCGASTECEVINHDAVCRCQQGFEGDPYEGCQRVATLGECRVYSLPF